MGILRKSMVKEGLEKERSLAREGNGGYLAGTAGLNSVKITGKYRITATSCKYPTHLCKGQGFLFFFLFLFLAKMDFFLVLMFDFVFMFLLYRGFGLFVCFPFFHNLSRPIHEPQLTVLLDFGTYCVKKLPKHIILIKLLPLNGRGLLLETGPKHFISFRRQEPL